MDPDSVMFPVYQAMGFLRRTPQRAAVRDETDVSGSWIYELPSFKQPLQDEELPPLVPDSPLLPPINLTDPPAWMTDVLVLPHVTAEDQVVLVSETILR